MWPQVELESVCTIDIGRTPSRDVPKYWQGNHTWVSIRDLNQGKYISSSKEKITDAGITACRCKPVPAGTLLYSFKLSIGKVAITKTQVYTNEAIAALVPKDPSIIDTNYLYYAVQMINLTGIGDTAVKGVTLNKEKLRKLRVLLPPLDVQQRIADTLNTADALRLKDQQLLRKYDELAHSIFNEMFEKLMGTAKKYALVDLAEQGRGNFTNGPFGSDLLTSELTDSGVPVIYIRDIRNGVFQYKSDVFVTKEKAAQLSATRITSGDVLLAKVGDPPGATAVYPTGLEDSIITQDVIRLRPDQKKVLPKYLQYYFNSEFGKHCFKPIIVEGTRSRFGLGDFKKLRIPVPPLELQQVFTNRIQLTEQLIEKSMKGMGVKQLFDSLLEKYFN